jgi:hypothetical protein
MSKFASKQFWVDALDRTLASFAQGLIGSAALDTTGLLNVEWQGVLSLAGSYALLSLLTSVAFRGDPDPRNNGLGGTAPSVAE